MPRPVTALLDANVLYSNALRKLLRQLALNDAFEARWTDLIEDEWLRNLEDRTRHRVSQRTLPLIRKHFLEVIVRDFDADQTIGDTDPKDRHVAGAAVAVAPCVLITNNLVDFDVKELAKLGVRVLPPDEFLVGLFDEAPEFIEAATREAASNLTRSLPSWDEYVADPGGRAGLQKFADRLRALDRHPKRSPSHAPPKEPE
ncbi:PIN domain-containing protein [Bradyrhizobium brasilense]|uniref:PIN domain-containing protein n=1 Tax=Bradyrhizobium brasilense TaxID=1419277 RepID=UPI0024B155A5|nr:PIN domain-containing protein [Bradyrhizobium australafricanum]WFU31457.1 PIN domain-containing protein [Bradyrhizobium australafricanum]